MSYTLRGRLETRLAASALPLLAACVLGAVLHAWWPVELAGLMLLAGLALDANLYDRVLPYQPGWYAVPLGLLELALVLVGARLLHVTAPLGPALALFGGAWLCGVLVTQAALPLLFLSHGDDGGELGLAGPSLAAAAATLLAGAAGVAFTTQRPTLHLARGVHQGPLVITRAEDVVGSPGAVVRGGIVIRASHVTVSHVTVVGGENGIDVENATHVTLHDVRVSGFRSDGIHARTSAISVMGCSVSAPGGAHTQGVDVSYAPSSDMSMIEGCDVSGTGDGIVTHNVMASLRDNHVSATAAQGIAMTEMSMGDVTGNVVTDAAGLGILCGDHSVCELSRNVVAGVRSDGSGLRTRSGIGILAQFYAEAELRQNHVAASPGGVAAMTGATFTRPGE